MFRFILASLFFTVLFIVGLMFTVRIFKKRRPNMDWQLHIFVSISIMLLGLAVALFTWLDIVAIAMNNEKVEQGTCELTRKYSRRGGGDTRIKVNEMDFTYNKPGYYNDVYECRVEYLPFTKTVKDLQLFDEK